MEQPVARRSETNAKGEKRKVRRVNTRALRVLAFLVPALAIGGVIWYFTSEATTKRSALAQVAAAEKADNIDLAFRYLDKFLEDHPDDVDALEVQARLLYANARTPKQYLNAANINDKLLRLGSKLKDKTEIRRKVITGYIRYSDGLRDYASTSKVRVDEAQEFRYGAAYTLAKQLVEELPNDSNAQLLFAEAAEGRVTPGGDPKFLTEAIAAFQKSLELDKKNVEAARRYALTLLTRKKDIPGARKVLDDLLKADPDSVEVRMTRYNFFMQIRENALARSELDAASQKSPDNLSIILSLANDALLRGDAVAARTQLDRVPATAQDSLQVRVLRGNLEFLEQHPDEAIDQWRKGLTAVGGTDKDLAWKLGFLLIQLGRIDAARPLVAQFERLEGDPNTPRARLLRGLLEQRAARYRKAIDEFVKARDKIPDQLRLTLELSLGLCYEAVGEMQNARKAFQEAIQADPQSPMPRRAIARLVRVEDPARALAAVEDALKISPNDLALLVEVARNRLVREMAKPAAQRNWSDFEPLLERAEKLKASDASVILLRADYLLNSGKIDQALAVLAAGTKGPDRNRPEIWQYYSNGLFQQNRREEALKVLEEASKPENAGDRASLRITRANLMAQLGHANAARELLTRNTGTLPRSEVPSLSQALGDLNRWLGDREGARNAFVEWAQLDTESAQPGLALLALASDYRDEEAARLGLEALKRIGGENQTYGLVARGILLLKDDPRATPEVAASRLDQAERIVEQLEQDSPDLALTAMLRGQIQERRNLESQAIESYRRAWKSGALVNALNRLVDLLTRQKRYDDLASLQREVKERARMSQSAGLATIFDQLSAAASIKSGDKARAEKFLADLVQARPDSLEFRASQARLLEELGKPSQAEATLTELVEKQPNNGPAWMALVALQSLYSQGGTAGKTIERIKTAYKGDRPDMLVARCRWMIGDKVEAARLFEQAIAARPNDLVSLRTAAEFAESAGRPDDHEKYCRAALKIDPTTSWAARGLAFRIAARNDPSTWNEAWSLVAPGASGSGDAPEDRLVRVTILARSPEAARRIEATRELAMLADDLPSSHPVGIEARTRLTQGMLLSNRPAEAARMIGPVAEDEARPLPIAIAMGVQAYARAGKIDAASRLLDRLVAIEPKTPRTAEARAWLLFGQDKKAEAAAEIEKAFEEAKSAPDAENLGIAYTDLALRFSELDAAERIATSLGSRWPKDLYYLARVQVIRKKYDDAIATCKAAIDAGSPREALRVAMNIAYSHQNDPTLVSKVEALAAPARAKDPKDAEVVAIIAMIRHSQGRYAEEVELDQQALDMNPADFTFLNNMAWTLSEGLKKPEDGLARIEEAIRRQGLSAQMLDTKGVILTRLGRIDDAIIALEQSAKLEPAPATFFHLARVYRKAGKVELQRQYVTLAKKANFDRATLDPTDRDELVEVMGES
jgi:tetratricopeptide (TPR) repeat protein